MAFDGRWTGVRGHTRFVGKCAEPTRQSWSKISSLASLSVRQLQQTWAQNTRYNTNKHIFAHSPTVCARVLGLLHQNVRLACGNFSMCHRDFKMMSKWHMGFTDQTTVETTLRKGILCASNSNQLQSNVSTSNSVTKILPVVVRTDSFQEEPQVLELRPKMLANGTRGRRSQMVEHSDADNFQ